MFLIIAWLLVAGLGRHGLPFDGFTNKVYSAICLYREEQVVEFGESVRFPAASDLQRRLTEFGGREPALTIFLSKQADGRRMSPIGAVMLLAQAVMAANNIERMAPEGSDGPIETWDFMRQLARALFDGSSQEAVLAAIARAEEHRKEE